MSAAAQAKGNKKNKQPSPAVSSSQQSQKQQKNQQQKRKEDFKQSDKKVKKEKIEKTPEEIEQEQQAELELVIGKVDEVNDELAVVEYELQLQVSKIEAQFQKKRLAIFEKRDEHLAKIPRFWTSIIANDKTIGQCLEKVDTEILESLKSITVQDFFDEKRLYQKDGSQQPANGFRVTLHFADGNKYVKAGKITTEIAILALPPKKEDESKDKAAKKSKNGNDDDEQDDDDEDEDYSDETDEIVISQSPETAFRLSNFAKDNQESFFASWFDNSKDVLEIKSLGEILRDIYRNPVPDDEEEDELEAEDEEGDE